MMVALRSSKSVSCNFLGQLRIGRWLAGGIVWTHGVIEDNPGRYLHPR